MTEIVGAGLRRVPGLDPGAPLPASDPKLAARIAGEIRERGPMTFARFMEIALYDPIAGYYTAAPVAEEPTTGPGREADFLTAPDSDPIFGWTIARFVVDVWERLGRPDRFVIREHGPGSGALGEAILDQLRRADSPLDTAIRYQPIEIADWRLGRIRERLEAAGLAAHLEPSDAVPAPGLVLANELLDALPVHRVEGAPPDDPRGGPLLERFIALAPGGSLTAELGAPSTPALAARLRAEGIRLEPGQAAEICLGLDGWVERASATLPRGALLVIDYGAPAAELYAPGRGATLRAYHRHRVHADPLVAIGRQDLTAHVDVTAVERAAAAAGLEAMGRATQAAFLADLGLGELLVGLQSEPGVTLERYLAARSSVARMLDPRATGGFAVMGFGRGLAEPGRSLAGLR